MSHPRFRSRRLLGESFLVTILVFLVMWLLLTVVTVSVKPLNYLAHTLKEIQPTDIYFSHLKNEADTDIVLVNIGELDRSGIALLVSTIAQASPRVIALDVLFDDRDDAEGDSLLNAAFSSNSDKLILAGEFVAADSSFNSRIKVFPGATYGHSNLITNEERTEPVRAFHPFYRTGSSSFGSFAGMIAERYAPGSLTGLEKRHHEKELINYVGDQRAFRAYQFSDLLNPDRSVLSALRDKVVMLGFLSAGKDGRLQDLADMFYTPVNTKYFGRSHPDMYGVVVHANIASMIIHGRYLDEVPGWLMAVLAFVIVYLHVVPFTYYFVRKPLWFHVMAKIIQLVSILVLLLLAFGLLDGYGLLFRTSYFLLGIFLAVDALYLYEFLAVLLFRRTGLRSMFVHAH